MAKETYHVVPHEQGWRVKREGHERASSTHDTQKDAIDSARNLADNGDDIVIHRADGTIRERITRTLVGNSGNGSGNAAEPARTRREVGVEDVAPVGGRISWSAVLGGAAVAFTAYVVLTLLALAIGITTVDHVRARTFAVGAAIVGVFNLLVALFLGGYIASLLTAGENRWEAGANGVMVWGVLCFALVVSGSNLASTVGMIGLSSRPAGPAAAENRPATTAAEATVQATARETADAAPTADAVAARGDELVANMNPTAVAWWAFAGTALSVLAAIGGGLVGAGPVFRVREARAEPAGRTAVQPA